MTPWLAHPQDGYCCTVTAVYPAVILYLFNHYLYQKEKMKWIH